mgnify:CR=1 FL=1
MRKFRISLLTLALAACAFGAQAAGPEIETLAGRARDLFDYGRWSDARQEFLRVRAVLTPSDRLLAQEADFYLAACAVELGSPDAEGALREFAERYPESVYANDVRFALGSFYCAAGNMEKAREAFAQTDYKALSAPRREQYDIRMGYVAFAGGDYRKAYDYFDRIGSRSEYADHARYYKAYIDYAEGRYGRAKQAFTALLRSDAYRDVVPYYLMQIEFREGNYRYVVENGETLARRAVPERRAELERVVAESWFRLEDFNRTLEHLAAFRKAGGEMDRDASYLEGFSLYRTARYAEAAEWLRKACGAEDALTQNASYHLADCYLRGGDKQQAMQSFAMASNAEFDSAIAEDALFNYGKLQYELGGGRFNEAIQVLNRYVAQYPSSPRVRTAKELLAAAYYNSHNYDEAYEIIASYPDPDGDLLAAKQKIAYFRGLSALEKGDTQGAGRYLAESARIGISPKYNALATFWQGEIAYGRGNYDVALRDYESYLKRAPKTEPEYAMAFYNTGYCHFSKENMPRARESFVRFIELYPTQDGYRTDARNRLGDTYYSDRQFDEALKYYGQAAAASDDGADYARYQRAVTLGILGRTSEKIKALQQIIRDGRGDYLDDATYELGRTFVAQERYREGAAVLEPFVETYVYSPYRSAALSELGLAYLNLGDKKKSLSYYDMVVKTAPQSSDAKDALQGIRDIYVSEGDAGGYFDYARKSGVEGDLTAMSRDSLSFAAARRIYLSGEPASAAKSLRSYLENYPKGYYTADALYCLSDCYLKTGERSRAIETLAALADAGQNQYTHRALKMLAGMTFADERFTEAAAAYRKLADAESTAAGKAEAMNGYVRATIAAGDEERILSMADDVASYTAAGDEAWRASQFAKAGILDRRGDAAAAQKIYKVLSANVKTPEGAESAYRVIESAFRAGDTARAEKLVLDFSDKGTPHAFWLAKSFLVLGDIYVQKGDMFQARATYQSIVDGYTPADDGIVAEAKEKIKKLN